MISVIFFRRIDLRELNICSGKSLQDKFGLVCCIVLGRCCCCCWCWESGSPTPFLSCKQWRWTWMLWQHLLPALSYYLCLWYGLSAYLCLIQMFVPLRLSGMFPFAATYHLPSSRPSDGSWGACARHPRNCGGASQRAGLGKSPEMESNNTYVNRRLESSSTWRNW